MFVIGMWLAIAGYGLVYYGVHVATRNPVSWAQTFIPGHPQP